jgi:hypothetical protein
MTNDGSNSGIYVPNDRRWPEHFRGLGIRIEDSVCVQEDGPLVLTTEALKEVNTDIRFCICFCFWDMFALRCYKLTRILGG